MSPLFDPVAPPPPKEDDGTGVNIMREAFEEALGKVGVHPILGGAVWRAYLRFEKDELEDAEETGEDDAEVSKALERRVESSRGQSSGATTSSPRPRHKKRFLGDYLQECTLQLKEIPLHACRTKKMFTPGRGSRFWSTLHVFTEKTESRCHTRLVDITLSGCIYPVREDHSKVIVDLAGQLTGGGEGGRTGDRLIARTWRGVTVEVFTV